MNISRIVNDTLTNSGYSHVTREPVVEQVVNAIGSEFDAVLANLRAEARSRGLSDREIDALFVRAGAQPEPEPEPEPETIDAAQAAVSRLAQQVDRLVQFAQQHGFRN